DGISHSSRAREDVVVPEAEQAEALGLQVRIANCITGILCMLGTIGLDDQARRIADEVHDIVVDRLLAAELERSETTVAEQVPQFAFGLGRLMTHSSSE